MERPKVVVQPDSKPPAAGAARSASGTTARRFQVVVGGGESTRGRPLAEKPRIVGVVPDKNSTFELLGAIQDCNLAAVRELLSTPGADLHVALKLIGRLQECCRREMQRGGTPNTGAKSRSEQQIFYETAEHLIVSHVADRL